MVTELENASSDAAVSRRAETRARAAAFVRGSRAPATWRAYDAKWRRFTAWCKEAGESEVPAEPRAVAEFLADLAAVWRPATPSDAASTIVEGQVLVRDGLRPATVEAYRAAISVATAPPVSPTRASTKRSAASSPGSAANAASPPPAAAPPSDPPT